MTIQLEQTIKETDISKRNQPEQIAHSYLILTAPTLLNKNIAGAERP
jgi:hypothetical protein